jgi:hypothetical protein
LFFEELTGQESDHCFMCETLIVSEYLPVSNAAYLSPQQII